MTTTEVKERPILFSGPMVRAILDGRKTQTRRIMKPQPPSIKAVYDATGTDFKLARATWMDCPREWHICGPVGVVCELAGLKNAYHWTCPYGAVGDRLYVREAGWIDPAKEFFAYRASPQIAYDLHGGGLIQSDEDVETITAKLDKTWKRSPSIHMPRWASRIKLAVESVRSERVQDISEKDALAEGIPKDSRKKAMTPNGFVRCDWPQWSFHQLWDSINAKRGYGWVRDPWVWALGFNQIVA